MTRLLPLLLALSSAVAFGVPFALGLEPTVATVFIGGCGLLGSVLLARRAGDGPWPVIAVTIGGVAITAIGGSAASQAWDERVRRDTSRDAAFRAQGVLVRAEASGTELRNGAYCAYVTVHRRTGGLRLREVTLVQGGYDELLLGLRCDLPRSLFDRVERANQPFPNPDRELDLVVLPTLIRDEFDRPVLDGYRFADEIGWVDPIARLSPAARDALQEVRTSAGSQSWTLALDAFDPLSLPSVGPAGESALVIAALGLPGELRMEDLNAIVYRAVEAGREGRLRVRFDALVHEDRFVPGTLEVDPSTGLLWGGPPRME